MKNIIYDKVFVGAGVIHIIEAIYQKKIGKNILVIEKKDKLGGAWRPIDVFGFKNVENAIHYFLPDDKAPKFMKDKLKWPIIKSEKKYKCVKVPFLGYSFFKYDGYISHLLSELTFNQSKIVLINDFFRNTLNYFYSKKKISYYINGGATTIYKSILKMVHHHNLNIKYNVNINQIYFDTANKIVKINPSKDIILAKQVVISHGSRLNNIYSPDGPIYLEDKIYPRPALHISIIDNSYSKIKECIFHKDAIVRYVHDVTHMIDQREKIKGKKIFIFGLHSNIVNNKFNIEYSFNLLKKNSMISKNSRMSNFLWTDTILPTLHDEDLYQLKNRFGHLIDYMKTEDFSRGLGLYCTKWSREDIFTF